ncbi:hypothetical protein ACM46_15055 [Chryseobacterium angstadtii]|uniref:Uncharacterized protein n=1 Tax=Chryseobacterium angstadtii TaxID=558151 RepID=A0A0J7I6B8_9FLAO|nr:DUF6624 domain-containing protein [Chryseobacterium angstadtii]KMQ61351.1 hypothetical protein ACM46_15055 [Chryseobacterium angstadtii]
MDKEFSSELLRLAQKDLSVRERLASEGKLSGGYHPEMESVHKQNAERLREIMDAIGFPTVSKVGAEASDAAWLIIQHSIGEPEFMKKCYEKMLENRRDINLSNLAYLHDRIHFFQGKPQRYGTQLTFTGVPYPVENKDILNEKREQMNLPALSQEEINRIPGVDDIPEIENQDQNYNDWRAKTGWT